MVKVFTLNKNNKIELTKQELEKLLNESYWEGYYSKNTPFYTYTTPSIPAPFITTTTLDTTNDINATLKNNTYKSYKNEA